MAPCGSSSTWWPRSVSARTVASTAANASRMRRRGDRRRHPHADPQRARILADARRERRRGQSWHVGSGRLAAADDVEHRRGVADRAGDHALHGGAVHGLAGRRARGGQSAAGFQADEPAAGRRDADRPAAVVGARARHDARGDRGRRPARGSAGRAPQIPRVARRPPRLRLGDALGAELGGVGLAEDDQPGVDPALDDRRRARRPESTSAHATPPRSAGPRSPGRGP